jgi:hypothetical protein
MGGGGLLVAPSLPPCAIVAHRGEWDRGKEQQDMKKWKRYRFLRGLVVAFAAAAVAVPVAQAQAQHAPGFKQPATAQSAKLVYGVPVASFRRLPADDQEAILHPRSVATGGYFPSALGKTSPVRTSTPVVFGTSDTFSWGDAGIWAGSFLVLTTLAALAVLLVCRNRMGQPAV